MAEDPKVSERYRELPREEPPRALDRAILAASRRAVQARWYFPLAAAAVIMLAVAVTVHVERERPDEETRVVAPMQKKPAEEAKLAEAPKATVQKTAPPRPAPERRSETHAQGEAASSADRRETEAKQRRARVQAAAAAHEDPRQPTSMLAKASAERSPEQWLQGIADLRRQGWHDEADKALAEFRKRHPDYKISEAMLEKLERSRAR